MGRIRIDTETEPLTPPNGYTYIYVDSVDEHLKTKDDNGLVIDLTAVKEGVLTLSREVTTKTNDYTLTANDSVCFVDATSNDVAITLPDAVTAVVSGVSKVYDISRVDGSSFTVTVNTTSSQTINGDLTFTMLRDENLTLISDGSNWRLL